MLSFEATVGAQQLSDEEIRAVVEEAQRHGLKVAAHAHGAGGDLAAVQAGVASIEHGSMLTDESLALDEAARDLPRADDATLRDIELEDLPPSRSGASGRVIAETAKASHRAGDPGRA